MRGNLDLPKGDRDDEVDEPLRPEPSPEVPLPIPPPKKGGLGSWLKALDEEMEGDAR